MGFFSWLFPSQAEREAARRKEIMETFPFLHRDRAEIELEILESRRLPEAFFKGPDEEVAKEIELHLLSATYSAATNPIAHKFYLREIERIGNHLRARGAERWENVTRKIELSSKDYPAILRHYALLGKAPQPDPVTGIAFDIDGLNTMLYGLAAYRLLFDAIEPSLLRGTRWSDGDTAATLAGKDRCYLICIETAHPENLPAIRRAVEGIDHPGLRSGAGRFSPAELLKREPLVSALRLDQGGMPDWSDGGFAVAAWSAAREERKARGSL